MTFNIPLRLTQYIRCPSCRNPLRFNSETATCCGNSEATIDDDILCYRQNLATPEMIVRDAQADGYLEHPKFPTQIGRLRRFIAGLPRPKRPILDLGCGPGPTTQLLCDAGFDVIAVDFSRQSLKRNRAPALFVQADLRDIQFAENSVDGLMMADFLQHLGGFDTQEKFLRDIFKALVSGGWFFLSVFNANIKNILKRDIDGSFAGGNIRYVRSRPFQIRKMLSPIAEIDNERPMNIFHGPLLDNIATRLPFAKFLGRMMVITGRKL